MTSEIEDIYSRFYLSVQDYDIVNLDEDVVDEMLMGYLKAVLSDIYVRRLYSKLSFDSDVGELTYTLREPVDDDFDKEYTEELISKGMIIKWLQPRYDSVLNTSQFFGNSEQKFFAQSNHMAQLKEMLTKAQLDFRRFIRDRGYATSLING